MKDVLKKVFEHPWGSAILVGAITDGIVKIIRATKVSAVTPVTNNVTTDMTN